MFAEWWHERKLRAIEREKELIRARCNHSWRYEGIHYDDFNAGSSVETTRQYAYKCVLCGAVKNSYHYIGG